MAPRSWVTSICTAIGVAVGAGAAQLGVGYGLSVVAWVPDTEDISRSVWLGSLAWVAWLSANSTIIGALCADRLAQRDPDIERPRSIELAWRGVITLAAGIGALVTVPLVAVPARVAQQANNSAPQFTAGGYAAVGVVIGLIVAFGVINVRAVAANVVATAAWLWVLAAVAVTHGLQLGTHTGTAQLATWQFSDARWLRGMVNLPGALLMLGMATLIGVAAAWRAGRQGDHRVGVAISGAVGPLLVAVAYFLAVPGIDGKNQQLSAYVTAPYAVIAGLAGSVLVSALGSKGSRERARLAKEDREAEEHAEWQRAMTAEDTPSGGTEDTAKSGSGRWSALKPRRGRAKTAKTTDPDDDDAYAPARAYGADTASTGKSGSTTSTGGSKSGRTKSTASSSPSTATPVWPEEAKPQSRRRKSAR